MSPKKDLDLSEYIDVAARLVEFRAAHPEGSLQPASITRPYRIETIGGQTFIAYTAVAYRTPDDPRPGVGVAWEPVPGLTPFTKNSELQNAETSAWGRAIVAALAADTRRSVTSAEEVRNRQAERDAPPVDLPISAANVKALQERCAAEGVDVALVVDAATGGRTSDPAEVLRSEVPAVKSAIDEAVSGTEELASGNGSGDAQTGAGALL